MTYLDEDDEVQVVDADDVHRDAGAGARAGRRRDPARSRIWCARCAVADDVARYAVRLVSASRPGRPGRAGKLDFIDSWVRWGAGLRASQALILGGKARALLHGRYHVSVADIRALAPANPAPSRHHQLLRRVRARRRRRHRHAPARRGAGAAAAASTPDVHARQPSRRAALPRPGRHRAAREPRAACPDHRRGLSLGAASQPAQGLLGGVRRVPAVPARRRPRHDRLEGVRAERSLRRAHARGRHEPQGLSAARCQRVDGLRLRQPHEAAVPAARLPRRSRT